METNRPSEKKTKIRRLVLIDANAIIHRAFHALPSLSSPSGEPTNAVYGFAAVLLRIFREMNPDLIAAAFDTPKPTFRHAAYAPYKATRAKAPDELYLQIPRVKELLQAFGVGVFEKEGFEADDVIGTMVSLVEKSHPETEVVIVTGDMDTLQLISGQTKVWTMRKGVADTVMYDEQAVKTRFGIPPSSLPDYKALRGDPSDNIPGVKGIGEKTAMELLSGYKNLEGLYRALEEKKLVASPAVQDKLQKGREDAFFSRQLVTIRRDTPIIFNVEKIPTPKKDGSPGAEKLFRELGFFSLLKRLSAETPGRITQASAPSAAKKLAGLSGFTKAIEKKPASAAVSFNPETKHFIVALPDNGGVFLINGQDAAHKAVADFFGSDAAKYTFDAKPIYKFFIQNRIRGNEFFDLMLAHYLLDPGQNQHYGTTTAREDAGAPESFLKKGPELRERLGHEDLMDVYKKIEAPLTPVLAAMELTGIRLESSVLKKLSQEVAAEISSLTEDIYQKAGGPFNIASPQQVSEVLFGRLKVSPKGLRRTGRGKISTKFSELSKLSGIHPVVDRILRHRELSKLKTTYLDPLPGFVESDGRLHTTFNQTRTETGRLASENPNLQNIPVKTTFGTRIRSAFAADNGWVLASFDYSQIELRIAADLAGDAKMIEAFRRGLDIHALTAAEVNNIPLNKVTPELRRAAKALNFGVLYGMGARGFAESAGVSVEEAELFIAEYFQDFKGIAGFIEQTKEFAREHGFVKTAFGRKRYLPGIVSAHPMIRAEAERMAVNMPVQGTATGDIMKKAMIETHRLLASAFAGKARMLLQIHDELICELRRDIADAAVPQIKSVMEGVWEGRVRLRVDVKCGKNWGELE